MVNLFEPIAEQDTQIEKSLVDLVQHITKQVIQRELAIDSTQIEHVMREALKLLPLGVGNVRLYINPQDFEQVKALRERHEETWRIVEDESLLPGGCRVETEHSRIDATVETRVAQVMAKLLDQLHDQALHPSAPDLSLDVPVDEKPVAEPTLDDPDAP
jgi:flagellar assembly protein FliH